MKERFNIILIVTLVFCSNLEPIFAQLSNGGKPYLFGYKKEISANYPFKISIDDTLELDDLQVAKNVETSIRITDNKHEAKILNGRKIWTLKVEIPEALFINLLFANFKLAANQELYIYSPNNNQVLGAFTAQNNKPDGSFAVSPLEGNCAIIEYSQAVEDISVQLLKLSAVGKGFKPLTSQNLLETCHLDINCPEAADYSELKRSVVHLLISDKYKSSICTGTLINTTDNSGKPYVITADHCYEKYTEVTNTLFYFNYENSGCNTSDPVKNNSLSGARLLAAPKNHELDYTLVEIMEPIPSAYKPYFAGWDRSLDTPKSIAAIHHPSGAAKKLSIENDPVVSASIGSNMGYLDDSHWKVLMWDSGATEGGSSGAPAFNDKMKLVGMLTGGAATCANPYNDYFSKLNAAWNYSAEPERNLKTWLDPSDTQTQTCNPYDPTTKYLNNVAIKEILSPQNCASFDDNFVIEIENTGNNQLTSLHVTIVFNQNERVDFTWTGNLAFGARTQIAAPETFYTEGANSAEVYLTMPNNLPDDAQEDNYKQQVFSVANDNVNKIKMLFVSRNGLSNVSWLLLNENTNAKIEASLPNSNSASTILCLTTGCYRFELIHPNIALQFTIENESLYKTIYNKQYANAGNEVFKFCIFPYNESRVYVSDQTKVFPNPFTEVVFIKPAENFAEVYSAEIFNMLGKRLFGRQNNLSDIYIDTSDYPPGVYWLFLNAKTRKEKILLVKI
ncbi:MAG TPA: hypothetical protein DCQ31_13380 [Bacteroidales bacterium]|nr:hypothetical protein [Bacteroidales bacterium]